MSLSILKVLQLVLPLVVVGGVFAVLAFDLRWWIVPVICVVGTVFDGYIEHVVFKRDLAKALKEM